MNSSAAGTRPDSERTQSDRPHVLQRGQKRVDVEYLSFWVVVVDQDHAADTPSTTRQRVLVSAIRTALVRCSG